MDCCLNINCKTHLRLGAAPSYAKEYFNMPTEQDLKICSKCLNVVVTYKFGQMLNLNNEPSGEDGNVKRNACQDNRGSELRRKIFGFYKENKANSAFLKSIEERYESVNRTLDKVDTKQNVLIHQVNPSSNMTASENCVQENNIQSEVPAEIKSEVNRQNDERNEECNNSENIVSKDGGNFLEIVEILDDESKNQKDTMNDADVIPVYEVKRTRKNTTQSSIQIGDLIYAMQNDCKSSWKLSRIYQVYPDDDNLYDVKFNHENDAGEVKTVRGHQLAFVQQSSVRFTIGSRVIAAYKKLNSDDASTETFHNGFVGEAPVAENAYRYLIFFDNGDVSYVSHNNIRYIHKDENWKEKLPRSHKRFVQQYFRQYPHRPMVRLTKDDVIKIKYEERWCNAKVIDVDGTLVHVKFIYDGHEELIYRGCTRLSPLAEELALAERCKQDGHRVKRLMGSKTENISKPFVEYTTVDQDTAVTDDDVNADDEDDDDVIFVSEHRNMAKKSSEDSNVSRIICKPKIRKPVQVPGRIVTKTVQKLRSKSVHPKHKCDHSCIQWTRYNPRAVKMMAPLSIPLNFGFTRMTVERAVVYVSPCGRKLKTMKQVHQFLRITRSLMAVDMFDFDTNVNCLDEFIIEHQWIYSLDITNGVEDQSISGVNYIDDERPKLDGYVNKRIPCEDVPLNLDPEFLCGCDCTDDCEKKEKCACWQLTIANQQTTDKGVLENAGYVYRRLKSDVSTCIYECNSRCKCSKRTCLNRVAQYPLSQKLQLFKTANKGWAVRCLNDIPAGAFVCIYVGKLLNGNEADKIGKEYTDDYFADLDFIEIMETSKENYESDVPKYSDSSHPSSDQESPVEEITEFENTMRKLAVTELRDDIRKKLRVRTSKKNYYDSGRGKSNSTISHTRHTSINSRGHALRNNEETTIGSKNIGKESVNNRNNDDRTVRPKSIRAYFGRNEDAYVMDARTHGNIGRYLNHSCEPNLFVQNVFVDTHDVRFPWITFFAQKYIRAGTELTWDYNYVVGSVKNVIKYCHCGSKRCRGRLL